MFGIEQQHIFLLVIGAVGEHLVFVVGGEVVAVFDAFVFGVDDEGVGDDVGFELEVAEVALVLDLGRRVDFLKESGDEFFENFGHVEEKGETFFVTAAGQRDEVSQEHQGDLEAFAVAGVGPIERDVEAFQIDMEKIDFIQDRFTTAEVGVATVSGASAQGMGKEAVERVVHAEFVVLAVDVLVVKVGEIFLDQVFTPQHPQIFLQHHILPKNTPFQFVQEIVGEHADKKLKKPMFGTHAPTQRFVFELNVVGIKKHIDEDVEVGFLGIGFFDDFGDDEIALTIHRQKAADIFGFGPIEAAFEIVVQRSVRFDRFS